MPRRTPAAPVAMSPEFHRPRASDRVPTGLGSRLEARRAALDGQSGRVGQLSRSFATNGVGLATCNLRCRHQRMLMTPASASSYGAVEERSMTELRYSPVHFCSIWLEAGLLEVWQIDRIPRCCRRARRNRCGKWLINDKSSVILKPVLYIL